MSEEPETNKKFDCMKMVREIRAKLLIEFDGL